MKTPSQDYGEPWTVGRIDRPMQDRHKHDPLMLHRTTSRAVSCVNACVGMTDPAAEIQDMRDAIKEAISQLDKYIHFLRSCDRNAKNCERVVAKLQPLLKP